MVTPHQLRVRELRIRSDVLFDSLAYLTLHVALSGQDEQDFLALQRQLILVEAELSALANTQFTGIAMQPTEIAALKIAARQLDLLISANAAARRILDSVASIMRSYVPAQSQSTSSSAFLDSPTPPRPLITNDFLAVGTPVPRLRQSSLAVATPTPHERRVRELRIRSDALFRSQAYLALNVSLTGQDEQDFLAQDRQLVLVEAELSALRNTQFTGIAMQPSEIDALENAAQQLYRLISENAAARNILNSVAAIMRSYVPAQRQKAASSGEVPIGAPEGLASIGRAKSISYLPASPSAIAEPTTPPPSPLLQTGLPRAEAFLSEFARPLLGGVPTGRYQGILPELAVELRSDGAGGTISSDLSRLDPAGQQTWVAAFRTVPDRLTGNGGPLVATDRYGAVSNGYITIVLVDETNIQVTLRFDHPLDGIPFGRNIVFIARFAGPALRELGLEMEIEKDVALPPTATFAGAPMNIEAALLDAGIAVISAGGQTELEKAPPEGWSEKDLEELMYKAAQSPLDRPEFAVHLLWLSKSNRPGLLGVMFDIGDDLPRQGLAVFAGEIASNVAPDALPRKLIQTAVHEIGHALNLAHRFEREIGRADSTSFMNYDWRYMGGGRAEVFWQNFAYKFDPDETAFLRHAPLPQIVPGGTPFRSVRYWVDGNGGYSPYVPEQPLPGYKLELLGPSQLIFEFGQPVLLGIRLTNQTGRRLDVPISVLDPKAGLLEILIRRVQPGTPPEGPPACFVPITTRCFDISGDGLQQLEPNQSIEDNLQLTFGASGFPFAEPGLYDVTAVLVFYDSSRSVDFLAPSNTLRLRIAYPVSREAERVAHEVLLRPDVGRWFALGAPTRLNEAQEDLLKAAEKAKGKDPIAVNIARTAMFGFARENDPQLAKEQANKISSLLQVVFDDITAQQTRDFISRLQQG